MSCFNRGSIGLSACAVVFAAGCGGGAQSGGASSGVHTAQSGEAVFSYFGQPKPQSTTSSGTVSVLAQAGATFSTITLEPPPNLNDTYLVYARQVDGGFALYRFPIGSGTQEFLFQSPYQSVFPNASTYGEITFNEVKGSTFSNWEVRPDGTGLRQVTFTGTATALAPQFSVDGTNRVAFWNAASSLYIAPGTGGAATLIQGNAVGTFPAWNPAGNQLAYDVLTGSSPNDDLYITATSGGISTDTTPSTIQGTGQFFTPSWNVDGVTIIAAFQPAGSSVAQIVKFAAGAPTNPVVNLTPNDFNDHEPSFSPDGSKYAFYRDSSGGATPGVYISDSAGDTQTLVVPDPGGGDEGAGGGISWSPFLPKETVVAASGSTFYHQASSGFLLSQTGSQFGSFVAFTAATPSSAAIQTPTGTASGAPLLFTITADSITSVGYINSYFNPGTTLSLSSTPSVVVSVDAGTGQVDMMAPAATPKPVPAKNANGTVTYNCEFKAIYDATGKNLAPSGARQLVIDSKTGRLVSFD